MQIHEMNPYDKLAISLFLSFTINEVIVNKDKMKTIDYDHLIQQICESIEVLFPVPFEA
tara:strand:+ start:69 stop:245 length:177 start_codon:yes stop_codon:yes gene_type:complete